MSNTPYLPASDPSRNHSLLERAANRALDAFERANEHSQAIFAGSLAVAGADTLVIATSAIEAENAGAAGILAGSLIIAATYARDAYDSFTSSHY